MKSTQAWGWLMAAVLAAGLNAGYHDGGMAWAHRIADRVEHNSAAVLALASGRTDRFLAEARLLTMKQEAPSRPLAETLADVRLRTVAKTFNLEQTQARLEAMSAREVAQFDRWEANRDRLQAEITAKADRFRAEQAVRAARFGRVNVTKCSWSER